MDAKKLALTLLLLLVVGLAAWAVETAVTGDKPDREALRDVVAMVLVALGCAALALAGFLHLNGII